MRHAVFRFYAELNDFLPPARRQQEVVRGFLDTPTVKDQIEACGVPHTEVEIILVNGRSVGFDHHLSDGDRVSVYPLFEALDVTPLVRLRPRPLRDPRFVLDVHLGKLARRLRLLGFDVLWERDAGDERLVFLSISQNRILLSRDRGLLKRRELSHAAAVHTTDPRRQLREVVERFDLSRAAAPFTRCLACNGLLAPAPKEKVLERIPPGARGAYDEFHECAACGKLYWWGSHARRLQEIVSGALEGS
ncbi:MAG: Mut7-C RNAse domain-containing protein [Thermoanaerobaculia bacterium]